MSNGKKIKTKFRGQAKIGGLVTKGLFGGGFDVNVLKEIQAAMDAIFGFGRPDRAEKKFENLGELYRYYTGDRDFTGRFNPKGLPPELRASAAISENTFPDALANTLNRFLSAGYKQANYFEDALISQRKPATHLHEGSFVELGFWTDLPTLDPEAEDYPDMPALTDSTNTFDLLQKGLVIPVSRRTILSDDVGLLPALIDRIGRVARKTHARYVWDFFVNNSNCNDGTAWFTVGHGN